MSVWGKSWAILVLLSSLHSEPARVEVRMLTPLRSWKSDEGMAARGVVIRPVEVDGRIVLPIGSIVRGRVKRVEPVGLGIRRERARLEVAFTEWEKPDGVRGPLRARVTGVDNAREEVDRQGRVRGILAASHPIGFTRGVWFRPRRSLLVRGPVGLTGAYGMAWARMAIGPLGAVGLIGARVALTRMPHPEIELPVGTELTLGAEAGLPEQGQRKPDSMQPVDSEFEEYLAALPVAVSKPGGERVADLINLAFIGTREELDRGFRAAGWEEAEPLTRRSFARAYRAFTLREGYPKAPVSKLQYEGRLPELVYQKSLNSIGKRHHIRIWRVEEPGGKEIWLGAATHDISVAFDRRRFSLTHRIDPELDREREKVVADLEFAGASASVGVVQRPLAPEAGRKTDGALRVVALRSTAINPITVDGPQVRPKSQAPVQTIRRVILETRQYFLRDNTYFWGYAAVRRLSRRQ